jgi:hypothetical protein
MELSKLQRQNETKQMHSVLLFLSLFFKEIKNTIIRIIEGEGLSRAEGMVLLTHLIGPEVGAGAPPLLVPALPPGHLGIFPCPSHFGEPGQQGNPS